MNDPKSILQDTFQSEVQPFVDLLEDENPENDVKATTQIFEKLRELYRQPLSIWLNDKEGEEARCQLVEAYGSLQKRFSQQMLALPDSYACRLHQDVRELNLNEELPPLTSREKAFYNFLSKRVKAGSRGLNEVEISGFIREEIYIHYRPKEKRLGGLEFPRSLYPEERYDFSLSDRSQRKNFTDPTNYLDWYLKQDRSQQMELLESWKEKQKGEKESWSDLSYANFIRVIEERNKSLGRIVNHTLTVDVGDSQASDGENSRAVAQYAKMLKSVGMEEIILTPEELGKTGVVKMKFESVNWTDPEDLRKIHDDPSNFKRPSAIYFVPESYKGSIPPKEEDKRQWYLYYKMKETRDRFSLGTLGFNRVGVVPKLEEYAPFFQEVYPPRSTNKDPFYEMEVKLPTALSYRAFIQAGERKSATDPYDNFRVTLSTEMFVIEADMSKPIAETLILGEEIARVTTVQNGRRVSLDHIRPETSNALGSSVPRLTPRAYAKYSPWVKDVASDYCSDTRTFIVQPGMAYQFAVDMSGVDAKYEYYWKAPARETQMRYDTSLSDENLSKMNVIKIKNGKQTVDIYVGQNKVITFYDGKEAYREDFDGQTYQKLVPIPGTAINGRMKFWISTEVVSSNENEVVLKETRPDATYQIIVQTSQIKYVVEKDESGNWFWSQWKWNEKNECYELLERNPAEDEYDARQNVFSYQTGTDALSMKKLSVPFKAKGSRVEVRFGTQGRENCDELRFDRIRLERDTKGR